MLRVGKGKVFDFLNRHPGDPEKESARETSKTPAKEISDRRSRPGPCESGSFRPASGNPSHGSSGHSIGFYVSNLCGPKEQSPWLFLLPFRPNSDDRKLLPVNSKRSSMRFGRLACVKRAMVSTAFGSAAIDEPGLIKLWLSNG